MSAILLAHLCQHIEDHGVESLDPSNMFAVLKESAKESITVEFTKCFSVSFVKENPNSIDRRT